MAKKLGERLIESGLITAEALEKALAQQRITGHKLGDSLVEIGVLQEATLLRFLAAEFKTRFAAFPDFREVLIADAGHMLHHDQPEQVAALIEEFCMQR